MNSIFIFQKYEFNPEQGRVHFFYELYTDNKKYNFIETLEFEKSLIINPKSLIKPFLDSLLLILGISYWKTFCPKKIETPTIQLTKDQADFWNTVYTKGLGEFFYENNIDYKGLVKFPYVNNVIPTDRKGVEGSISTTQSHETDPSTSLRFAQDDKIKESRSLLFFGGGKDSIVSAELLKKAKKQFTLLQINTSQIQEETAKIVNKDRIIIKRIIDPKLFELNKKPGTYNGHVPITAIWEFIGLFAAYIYSYQYVVSSNEHSANYGNVKYLGEEINHQWSKSLEFENRLQEYTKKYITSTIIPFSILRPFNELQIVKQFVHYPHYFPYFSSCNTNFKLSHPSGERVRWCGKCPKCLFIFILLSAVLKKETVLSIFGDNLLNNKSLSSLFKELLGIERIKPFECVGTPEEVRVALYMIFKKEEFNKDSLMKFFASEIIPKLANIEEETKKLLEQRSENNIPKKFSYENF